ncbi:unnamed protein product, partial [Adineta steineri]
PSLPYGYVVMAGAQQIIVNQVNVSDYLIWSILNSLFCLWPVGILATVMSVITKKKKANCDLEGARKFSILAGVFNILSTLGEFLSLWDNDAEIDSFNIYFQVMVQF